MTGRVVTLLTTLAAATVGAVNDRREIGAPVSLERFRSVPIGLYRLRPIGRLAVTELVAVRPPEPTATFLADGNYLPRNVPMLKRVLALPGQTVCREHLTITVDAIAMGVARERDSRGRPLPVWQGCRVVADGEVFLMNWQSADSLDGRYFGVLPISAIIGKAEPLWTERGGVTMPQDRRPSVIPLFGQNTDHSSVPAKVRTAVARSDGPGRPSGRRASASPLTAASTMAALRSLRDNTVHCSAPGGIDAVERSGACRASIAADTSSERSIR